MFSFLVYPFVLIFHRQGRSRMWTMIYVQTTSSTSYVSRSLPRINCSRRHSQVLPCSTKTNRVVLRWRSTSCTIAVSPLVSMNRRYSVSLLRWQFVKMRVRILRTSSPPPAPRTRYGVGNTYYYLFFLIVKDDNLTDLTQARFPPEVRRVTDNRRSGTTCCDTKSLGTTNYFTVHVQ